MSDESGAPRSVVWLWALRDRCVRHGRMLLLLSVLQLAVGAIVTGISTIDSGETGVRLRLGRMDRNDLPSGLTLSLPRPIDEVVTLDTAEVQRLTIQGAGGRLSDFVSGDENLVRASLIVQYRVVDPGEFLFATEDAKNVLEHVVRGAFVEAIASLAVDDLLTFGKSLAQESIRSRAQERLAEVGAGVSLIAVNLQDVEPPAEATEAFRAVVDARARSAEQVSRIESQEEQANALARAEANRMVRLAEADATAKVQSAESSASAFDAILPRYRAQPRQTRADLITRARVRALGDTRIFVVGEGKSAPIDLYLGRDGNR
ncbi:MAG: protease modulator HflK [Acidobacteriota bacterium]